MITNQDKIDIIVSKLNNLEMVIKSYIDHAEEFKGKYNLTDKLASCNFKKNILLNELFSLGGSWTDPLTNQD